MIDHNQDDVPPQPTQIPETTASSYKKAVAEGWMVEMMMQVQRSIGELSAHVFQIRTNASELRQESKSDFRWTWSGIAAAVVLVIGALIYGYFRLDDRQNNLNTGLTKIETKLDDLLQRIPPAPIGAPSPRGH
jgi:hypothetical protein